MAKNELVKLNIEYPDDRLFKQSAHLLELANNWEVLSPEMAVSAGEDLRAVKALAKQVDEKRLTITRPINDGLKEVNALFKPAKNWLAEAEQILKAKILAFQNEQERIARELQAKVDEEARKEREKLEKKAAKAEAKGKEDKAEELREEAETRVAPMITSAAPKLEGIATRKTWKVKVTDKQALLKHIVHVRPDLLPLVKIDLSGLNAQARSLKGELVLPGLEVSEEVSLAARRR